MSPADGPARGGPADRTEGPTADRPHDTTGQPSGPPRDGHPADSRSDGADGRPAERRWLTRNVKVLSGVSLAQDAASELMYPLLPVLLTTTLGAPAAIVGAIEGIAEGISALLKYVSGRVSDRTGRKPAILAGYGMAAVGKVIVAAASAWPAVLAGRVVDRVGKGIRGAPRDALLAEGIAQDSLGRAFGFHRMADTVGAVVGPLIGLAILAATDSIHVALWVAVIPACLSVGLILLVREPARPAAHRGRDRTEPPPAAGQRSPHHPAGALPAAVRSVAAVLGLFALVNFPDALILLRLTEVGLEPAQLMGAYALFNLASAAVALPAGALSDRWPRSRVYSLGLACFAIGYLGLGLATSPGPAVALLLLYGGFAGITEGVGRAWISALAPPAVRGRALGLLQGLSGVGILVAGVWAGLAWDAGPGGGVVPLLVSGAVAGAAALGLAMLGGGLEPAAPAR